MMEAPRAIVAILALGTLGVLILGLQPQLLGALAAEGRISIAALGPLATTELLAMGLAAGGAAFVLPIARLRTIAVAALVVIAAADLATTRLDAAGLFAARLVAGLGEGALVWIAIGFIVRRHRPERWSGIYLAVQTLAQFGIAAALGSVAASSTAGFAALAGITAAGLLLVPLLPRSYASLVRDPAATSLPPARGLVALAGVLCYLAFIVAIWVYIEPLAATRGVPPRLVHVIAPLSLGLQVLGAGTATLLAGRANARVLVAAVAAINLVLLGLMAAPPSATVFVVAAGLFGFLWLFALPFQVPLVIAADPTRRAALLVGGAQLAGSSLGPLFAGLVIAETDPAPVLWLGAVALLVAVALLTLSVRRA